MGVTKLYMIRHGESQANEKNVFLGFTDLDLTEKGKEQAKKTAAYLQNVGADAVYASDLLRAYHTAEATATLVGLPVQKTAGLREIFAGEWENQSFDDLEKRYAESYGVWIRDIGLSCPDGGESVEKLQQRVVAELESIAKANEGKTVLVFTHATPIRCFAAYCKKQSLAEMKTTPWAGNASVSVFTYENGEFSLVEYGVNDFLGDIATKLPENV